MLIEFVNPLNSSALAFPILECIHIVAFALSIGTIAIVDFRLLDMGMRRQTPAQLAKDTAVWTLVGLGIMLLSGMALWMGVVFGGIFIGFLNPTLDLNKV
ncbi:MAG TPA: hypothetical protein VLM42_00910 [Bryobacteraceae bacterium]|nr:hypothetical protein [Bryobacteraceae bacterium]